jgi:hypothetical protein
MTKAMPENWLKGWIDTWRVIAMPWRQSGFLPPRKNRPESGVANGSNLNVNFREYQLKAVACCSAKVTERKGPGGRPHDGKL